MGVEKGSFGTLSPYCTLFVIFYAFTSQVYCELKHGMRFKPKNITIGYLTVDQTDILTLGKQGRAISGAITYAIEQINQDKDLLPEHKLQLIWGDTMADTLVSTRILTDQWREGAQAFIGLEDKCTVEAKVAAAWNLPMISYKCADYEVSNKLAYPTFARTFPPATQVAKPIISLLLHYDWLKFTLIVGALHKFRVIAHKIREMAGSYNLTINQEFGFSEPHIPMITGNPFPGIVENTFVDTRVYVFLGTYNGIVDMMTNMYDRGLLDTGEYVLIYYDHETVDTFDPLKYFGRTSDPPLTRTNEAAVQSLFVITGSYPSNPEYEQFKKTVSEYGEKEPFNFPNPFMHQRKISVYAAYLYDAVWLYARAAHEVMHEGGNITNGTAIIGKLLGTNYTGIQGFLSQIDENGDAEGNYTLLTRQPFKSDLTNYSMRPVGNFRLDHSYGRLPTFKLFENKHIYWVAGAPPIDEPLCGYRAERCIPPKTYTLEIVGGILGGILLVVIIVGSVLYRIWRYEQEIAGLLWRISPESLKLSDNFSGNDRRASFSSRMTLSQLSVDSKMSFTQVYARTGVYKGQIVALKVYEQKPLCITWKMKKEMKIMRDLRHTNINTFLGACIDPPSLIIVTEYCSKGSLLDILENEDVKLDNMFIASLVKDIIQGMIFLHDSELGFHGNLKSSNCVVNSRWSLQITDFGLLEVRAATYKIEDEHAYYRSQFHGNLKSSNCVVNSRWSLQITDFGLLEVRAATYKIEDEHAYYRNLFWRAPEILRQTLPTWSAKGDVYSFGIILHEIFGRAGPFGFTRMPPKDVIDRVRECSSYPPFRPDTKTLDCDSYIIDCMESCWHETPDNRPDFRTISKILQPLRRGMKRGIFDNMMAMMEKYQKNLEDLVDERTTLLVDEKKKTEALLLRMLPRCVADQLKLGYAVVPESYNSVTIYFSDICGFTKLSAESTPLEIVDMLNDLYTLFDETIRHFDVYKIETIGDAYMVCSGLPIRNGDNHAGEIASMSLKLLTQIRQFRVRHRQNYVMSLRIGMHSGPCVAGVVGLTMPRYTLFGDSVNTASRMETNGEPMKVHCSQDSKDILDKLGGYTVEPRGNVPIKGKGEMFTYWLLSEDESIRSNRVKQQATNQLTPYRTLPSCNARGNQNSQILDGIKGSPNHLKSSLHLNIDSDSNSNFQEPSILDLLREGDTPLMRPTRCESPNMFFHKPFGYSAVTSPDTIRLHHKSSFKNGVRPDSRLKSYSGTDLSAM